MFGSWNGLLGIVGGIIAITWRGGLARGYFDLWIGRRFLGMQVVPHPEERLKHERSARLLYLAVGIIFIISGVWSLFKHHM